MLKLILNSPVLVEVSNWDLNHKKSGPSDVQLTFDTFYMQQMESSHFLFISMAVHTNTRLVISMFLGFKEAEK